jgi:hypothetical protein
VIKLTVGLLLIRLLLAGRRFLLPAPAPEREQQQQLFFGGGGGKTYLETSALSTKIHRRTLTAISTE